MRLPRFLVKNNNSSVKPTVTIVQYNSVGRRFTFIEELEPGPVYYTTAVLIRARVLGVKLDWIGQSVLPFALPFA